jgi:3-methyladenine DNA glycosylase AlkD
MDNPTFTERTAALKQAANQFKECAEIVLAEAQRMEVAQSRFAQRAGKRTSAPKRKAA